MDSIYHCRAAGMQNAIIAGALLRRDKTQRENPLPGKLSPCGVAAVIVQMLALAACVPAVSTTPAVVETRVDTPVETGQPEESTEARQPEIPEQPEEQAIAHAMEREQSIIVADDPGVLLEQAEVSPPEQAVSLLLPAIAGFLERGELATAQTLIGQLQTGQLSASQRHSLQLHRAQLSRLQGRHEHAVATLRLLEQSPGLGAETRAELLWWLADSQQALRHNGEAVATLLRRDQLPDPLPHPAGRTANQQRILALVGALDPLSRALLRENPPDDSVDGWIALSEILQSAASEERLAGIQQWRTLYPGHPAEQLLSARPLLAGQSAGYRHIALLLPLTSPFGVAARAFYEGFMASRTDDPSPEPPAVRLYDIGEDPQLVPLYYRAAIDEGADFVVGPLGRRAVDALLADRRPQLPTLLVGAIPADKAAPTLYGISLSPEQETGQVAERVFAEGHRQAGIFRSNSAWGRRVANAFAQRWESLGGTVVANHSFPVDISDYSRVITKFLGLDRSIARERLLSAQLGKNLQFTPRRRDDIDFLFLAANADQARLLVPQLRFFQAHDLAVYATSHIYDGKPDPATDADLDGVVFGDMDWVLRAAVVAEPSPGPSPEPSLEPAPTSAAGPEAKRIPRPGAGPGPDEPAESLTAAETPPTPGDPPASPPDERALRPYYHTGLDRLYALGLESYRLLPALAALRNNPWQRHFGKAMDISVDADGNAVRHLTWARFEKGLPVPLPGLGIDARRPHTGANPAPDLESGPAPVLPAQ